MCQEQTPWKAKGMASEPGKDRKNLFSRLLWAPQHYWQRRKAITALHLLSDEMLADLGISRGQIPDIVDDLIASGLTAASVREVVTDRERLS